MALLGGAAGAVVLAGLAVLAAGIDGLRPAALLAPLLTALSPPFAASALAGGREAFLAACIVAGSALAFAETHTAGRWPLSALCFGAAGTAGPLGLAALTAAFAQRIAFARRFRLPRRVLAHAVIWLGLALAVAAAGRLLSGPDPAPPPGAPPPGDDPGTSAPAGLPLLLAALWREADGLAVLPAVLVLLLGWKPKAAFFRLSLAGLLLAAWLPLAARAPAAGLDRALAPVLPIVFLVIGEALAAAGGALEAVGLRGRRRAVLAASVIGALALGQAWPTLALLAGDTAGRP
jgi:hypothetical protein